MPLAVSSARRGAPDESIRAIEPPANAQDVCQAMAIEMWMAVSTIALRANGAQCGMNCGITIR